MIPLDYRLRDLSPEAVSVLLLLALDTEDAELLEWLALVAVLRSRMRDGEPEPAWWLPALGLEDVARWRGSALAVIAAVDDHGIRADGLRELLLAVLDGLDEAERIARAALRVLDTYNGMTRVDALVN